MSKRYSIYSPTHIVSKVGLNGVTHVTKIANSGKDQQARQTSRVSGMTKDHLHLGKPKDSNATDLAVEDELGYHHGYITTDEFLDMNNSHRSVTLSSVAKLSDSTDSGKIGGGSLLKFFEETGSVVCTRYCNFTSSEQSLRTGSLFDQVYCGMVYLDYLELLLPAFPGDLLTCVADIYYTSAYAIEVKSVMWAEDLVSCSRRIVGKSSAWFVSFNVNNEWKLTKVPKLAIDPSLEREGNLRFEKYKEERKRLSHNRVQYQREAFTGELQERTNKGKVINAVKYSEITLTHVASIHDCGLHKYMLCGSLLRHMEEAALLVAKKHCGTESLVTACGYNFVFLELIPKGSMMMLYAHLMFTSKRVMEVEIIANIEVINNQTIDTKRVAIGYFAVLGQNNDSKIVTIPNLKLHTPEEEVNFSEGQKRFEDWRKHLKYTDMRLGGTAANELSESQRAAAGHK